MVHPIRRLRNTYLNIRRVLYYLPVVWRDRSWDHEFIWILLRHKLARCESYFRESGCGVGHIEQADEIHRCILVLDRMIAEDYGQPPFGEYSGSTKKWVKYESDMMQQDMDYLFKQMRKHLRGWWD